MKKEIGYSAKGQVLGNIWGGGQGSYPTILLKADTLEELLEKGNTALKDGSLDSGMGFEKLIGSVLDVTIITTIIFEDKEFTNEEIETHLIGDLKEDEIDFLLKIY